LKVIDEDEETNNLFSEFKEDTVTIIENLEESAKLKHERGLECWCYKNKGHWIQSIEIGDLIYGAEWSNDGSIFCWLCLIDEVDKGIPLHHTSGPIYTNEEFTHHVVYDHKGKELSEYLPRLPSYRRK
jgi:hypothetical protein